MKKPKLSESSDAEYKSVQEEDQEEAENQPLPLQGSKEKRSGIVCPSNTSSMYEDAQDSIERV